MGDKLRLPRDARAFNFFLTRGISILGELVVGNYPSKSLTKHHGRPEDEITVTNELFYLYIFLSVGSVLLGGLIGAVLFGWLGYNLYPQLVTTSSTELQNNLVIFFGFAGGFFGVLMLPSLVLSTLNLFSPRIVRGIILIDVVLNKNFGRHLSSNQIAERAGQYNSVVLVNNAKQRFIKIFALSVAGIIVYLALTVIILKLTVN